MKQNGDHNYKQNLQVVPSGSQGSFQHHPSPHQETETCLGYVKSIYKTNNNKPKTNPHPRKNSKQGLRTR